ncbi:DNA repair protein RAD51 [Dimargaris cristalligena]|uniref:P-loop containing nucleoside triphosphate hydrolase protein n=1 Tax=Dimargaris cristalligena TaxID=215637 RepID=A0A4P9ZMA7_9FUNG|nr:DNA repair protein RAD51 [Dimargaris cristalligena]RKP34474.1 P-loop containing nucleoside triphosphate hydrolase protein [Dimargaris cristalligena]|eukprot:RKP34474.1 P-loop containing nucleoside triphosphate hydrolase protein [Dimargaris cristalligena]
MAHRPLHRLPPAKQIAPAILAKLPAHGPHRVATCGDLLRLSLVDLAELCDLNSTQAAELHRNVCSVVYALPSRATSIVGAAGMGKTQFCLTVAVTTTLPHALGGWDAGVLYIDTEGSFSASRFREIATQVVSAQGRPDSTLASIIKNMTDKIHVLSAKTVSELRSRIEAIEPMVIQHRIRLIIVDSIAFVMRRDLADRRQDYQPDALSSNNQPPHRFGGGPPSGNNKGMSDLLTWEASNLKYIAETFQIPVVVTNQITTRFRPPTVMGVPSIASSDRYESAVTAALGNTWAHLVTTRLVLRYSDERRTTEKIPASHTPMNAIPTPLDRTITVAKSPIVPTVQFDYRISSSGFVSKSPPTL